jgi:hypothetical protein
MEVCEQIVEKALEVPHVPHGKRIIPNDLIRSSLFSVRNHRTKRDFLKDRELYSFGNTQITFTGEELRQDDEDVWLQMFYLMSKNNQSELEFRPYSILKQLGWPGTSHYKDKLKDCIKRMSANDISIVNKDYNMGLSLSLIRKFAWKDEVGDKLKLWKVWFEPEIVKLFSGFKFTKIDWKQRMALTPLAKWLHSFYSSHKDPYPIKVATIRSACGSGSKHLKHFRPLIRSALTDLVKVGFLEDFYIDAKDLVYVVKRQPKYISIPND